MRNQLVKELYKDMAIGNEVNQFVRKGINKIRTIPLPKHITARETELITKPTLAAAEARALWRQLSTPQGFASAKKMSNALPLE